MRMSSPLASIVLAVASTLPLSIVSPASAAPTPWIGGTVTDTAGVPIRGAMVKVKKGTKSIARYTDKDGRYRIQGLQEGLYEVTANAFGHAIEKQSKDVAQAGAVNFKLPAKLDVAQMDSAELRFVFPDDKESLRAYYLCSDCHGLETALHGRGMPAAAWEVFLQHMTEGRWGANIGFTPQVAAALAPTIEKAYGPNGILGPNATPDLTKVKHTPLKDAALKATITEYDIPSKGAQPHSVRVDDRSGIVWFSEYDAASNNIARFDPKTERFQEFKIPLKAAQAHTGAVLKDGRYIVALDSYHKAPIKLAAADANGKIEVFEWAGKPQGARVAVLDPVREDMVWIVAGPETWSLNLKTKQFRAYKNPVADSYPEGSYAAEFAPPGGRPDPAGYDITVDSKGAPWVTQIDLGVIFKLDPDSGKTTSYHTSEMKSARGITIDAHDNVWFADYFGHKLGRLDTKTGAVKMYQPPSPYASPYGVAVDRRRGHVWYADTTPNNITRFDPKSEEFVEYPIPTQNAAARFVGIDADGKVWYGGFWNQKLGVIDPGDGPGQLLSSQSDGAN